MNANPRWHDTRRAVEATKNFRDGHINADKLAESCMPLIRHLCRVVAHKMRMLEQTDDLAQEVWIIFERKLAAKYDDQYPVEPIVLECARRTALRMLREAPEVRESDMGEDEATIVFQHRSEQATEIDIGAIDRRNALEQIAHRVYDDTVATVGNFKEKPVLHDNVMSAAAPQDIARVLPAIRGAGRKTTESRLTEEQKELVSIRTQLRMTQQEFSDAIGIGMPTLSSYEYGKVRSVDSQVLERARRLMTESNTTPSRFDGRDMPEILKEWAEMLEVEFEDSRGLATALRVSTPTISRWKRALTRPSNMMLEDINTLVVATVAKRSR